MNLSIKSFLRAANKEDIKVRFSDVAGAEEENKILVEVVEFFFKRSKCFALNWVQEPVISVLRRPSRNWYSKPSVSKVKLEYHSLVLLVLTLSKCLFEPK